MNKFIDKNITKIIYIFLLLTPLLDLITSISLNVLNLSFNYITIIKMLFMFLFIYEVIISKSKYKKVSIIYLLFILVYFILFVSTTILYKPSSTLTFEITNFLRTFYFPINLVCLLNIYDSKKLNIGEKEFTYILLTYILLMFIPIITNTGFNSYKYSKEGTTGWFNSTNEIGGIVSILLPMGIYYFYKNKKYILGLITSLITLLTLFKMGTKVPVLSIGVILFFLFLKYLVKVIKLKEVKKITMIVLILLVTMISSFIIIPKTTFYKNIMIHLNFLKVDEVSDFADTKVIDKFIFSDRISYYNLTKNNYMKSTIYEKINGIGYTEYYFNDPEHIKMIEMDYFDIIFRHGIFGFILFFIPYLYILINIFKNIFKLKTMNLKTYLLFISLFLILTLSLFSGHIIVAPSVSLIVIFILLSLNEEVRS